MRKLTLKQMEALARAGAVPGKLPGINDKIAEPTPEPPSPVVVQLPDPQPCTLKVNRNKDGFIDTIDVIPVPRQTH